VYNLEFDYQSPEQDVSEHVLVVRKKSFLDDFYFRPLNDGDLYYVLHEIRHKICIFNKVGKDIREKIILDSQQYLSYFKSRLFFSFSGRHFIDDSVILKILNILEDQLLSPILKTVDGAKRGIHSIDVLDIKLRLIVQLKEQKSRADSDKNEVDLDLDQTMFQLLDNDNFESVLEELRKKTSSHQSRKIDNCLHQYRKLKSKLSAEEEIKDPKNISRMRNKI
jgi:hypothetical protein